MERSFAQAKRHGFEIARWRRLWRVQIQECMVAAIQNIRIFLNHYKEQREAAAMKAAVHDTNRPLSVISTLGDHIMCLYRYLQHTYRDQRRYSMDAMAFS